MATVAELKAAREQGKADWLAGVNPDVHPSKAPGELYEAWYDGWEAAEKQAEFLSEEDFE